MTDRPAPDPSPADPNFELASAYLDGEVTPDEAALVEGDAALATLVEDLRGLVPSLDPGDAPAALAESHVAAALAAYDDERGSSPAASVTALGTARADRSRSRWYDRIPLGAVAAAALLVALVGGLSLVDFDGSDTDTAAGRADRAGGDESLAFEDSGGAMDAAEGADGAAAGAGGGAPVVEAPRPTFADVDVLAAFVSDTRAQITAPASGDAAGGGGGGGTSERAPEEFADPDAACDLQAVAQAAAGPGAVQSILAAFVAGQPVSAFVIETSEGPELVVVDETTCSVTDQRPLDG